MRRVAVAAALLAAVGTASAGGMLEASISGQTLQYLDAGQVNGCGLRFVGIVVPNGLRETEGFDVSVNVSLPGIGMVKGGRFTVTTQDLLQRKPGKATRERPSALWLRAMGHKATQPHEGKIYPSQDTAGSSIYATDGLADALALFNAVSQQETIQVGIMLRGETVERVYYGMPEVSPGDLHQLASCMDELTKRLK